MKYLLLFFLFISPVYSAMPINIDMIHEVRTLEHDELLGEVRVTFWGNNKVYQMDEGHSSLACLEDAYKSGAQVALSFDPNDRVIIGCKILGEVSE